MTPLPQSLPPDLAEKIKRRETMIATKAMTVELGFDVRHAVMEADTATINALLQIIRQLENPWKPISELNRGDRNEKLFYFPPLKYGTRTDGGMVQQDRYLPVIPCPPTHFQYLKPPTATAQKEGL